MASWMMTGSATRLLNATYWHLSLRILRVCQMRNQERKPGESRWKLADGPHALVLKVLKTEMTLAFGFGFELAPHSGRRTVRES